MASPGRRKGTPLIEELFQDAYRFEFFQAVRILERYHDLRAKDDPRFRRIPVGYDGTPDTEIVRFAALAALSFPAGSISEVRDVVFEGAPSINEWDKPPMEMLVAFLGLTGPHGVLPRHYTSLILKRMQEKDYTLRDFLDLFNHRVISLFTAAWEKYRFPLTYERRAYSPGIDREDLFMQALHSYVGMGTDALRGRLEVDDESFLFYAGFFSHFPRSALPLESILSEYFSLPVQIEQFQGQWLYLNDEDLSRIPSRGLPLGVNAILGVNLIAGRRTWDVQSKFRIRIGPVSYSHFQKMMPIGDMLRPLCQLVRMYVGLELDFDVQPVLKASEVPWFRLDSKSTPGPRLGWNTWSRTEEFHKDVAEVCFFLDGHNLAQ
ncbi:MAG: type VI secretion system baseplate subunit TssG [Planctomycetota bacterium]